MVAGGCLCVNTPGGTRTRDLMLGEHLLYPLSYGGTFTVAREPIRVKRYIPLRRM